MACSSVNPALDRHRGESDPLPPPWAQLTRVTAVLRPNPRSGQRPLLRTRPAAIARTYESISMSLVLNCGANLIRILPGIAPPATQLLPEAGICRPRERSHTIRRARWNICIERIEVERPRRSRCRRGCKSCGLVGRSSWRIWRGSRRGRAESRQVHSWPSLGTDASSMTCSSTGTSIAERREFPPIAAHRHCFLI